MTGFTLWCCFKLNWISILSRFSDCSVHSGSYYSFQLGPMRWILTTHCAGRRGLNILTAVRPVKLALCVSFHNHRWNQFGVIILKCSVRLKTSICLPAWNLTDDFKIQWSTSSVRRMTSKYNEVPLLCYFKHIAWSSTEEVLHCILKSSVKFKCSVSNAFFGCNRTEIVG